MGKSCINYTRQADIGVPTEVYGLGLRVQEVVLFNPHLKASQHHDFSVDVA